MSADLVEASGRVLDAVVAQMGGSPREGQASMVAEGAAALEDRQHLLVQAGTGTGKSVGYLVPLLTHCATNGVRGVVSTATLALQRQILVKDAPAVVDAVASQTGARLKVAVLKGWSNYACLHKLDGGYPTEGTLFEDRDVSVGPTGELGKEILRIREWISETTTGDRDDLVPGVSDRAWHHASVAKPECLGKHCPLVDECFAQAARLEAADADVVVTNHSLFGINACGEGELFGEYDAVVIDEAHELADRVRSQAAADLTVARVSRVAPGGGAPRVPAERSRRRDDRAGRCGPSCQPRGVRGEGRTRRQAPGSRGHRRADRRSRRVGARPRPVDRLHHQG